jgi:hypothetical protein
MISRRSFFASCAGAAVTVQASKTRDVIRLKVPEDGLQPQAAVDAKGVIHLIYLYGDPQLQTFVTFKEVVGWSGGRLLRRAKAQIGNTPQSLSTRQVRFFWLGPRELVGRRVA